MIVATAGHVDHGKTSLVKQLTGVDTDRLEEEKRRGLSINLGYAYLPIILPGGGNATLGFIDVPGHSRFLNTMISGVSGIDLGLLVVAANDGPMPQTIEHIQVMGLLGVRHYAVAITHIDTVGADRIAAVSAAATSLLAAQGCREDVAVFPVDNLTGEGIPELADFLTLRAAQRKVQDHSGLFRMSIDRAFLLKGSGLIVTGTARSGAVGAEEHLLLLPQRKKLRVRSIHADDQATDRASGGQRCALNIVGDVERGEINRGDWLVTPEAGPTTRRFDTRLRLLGSASFGLKHLSPVTLYLGASRLKAKVSLLEEHGGRRKLGPGDEQLAQLLLEREVSCCHGDRFLLRDDSETHLLGGGVVIDPWGLRAGKGRPERLSQLVALEEPEFASTLAQLIGEREEVVDLTRLAQARNLSISEARKILEQDSTASQIFTWQDNDSQYCASMNHYRTVERRLLQHLADWHRDNPLEKGMPVKLGRQSLPGKQDIPLLLPATAGLVEKGEMKLVGGLLSLPGHRISMDSGDTMLWSRIEASLQKHGKILPPLGDLAKELKQDPQALLAALRRACAAQALHQISDRRFALPQAMIQFAAAVNAVAECTGRFSVIEYRDHLAIGRNQAVELLEYFDRVKFTRRQGNERIVLDEEFPRQYRTATIEQE